MTFSGNSLQSNHTCDQNANRSSQGCEQNVNTRFVASSECGDGINDRITSDGEGRVTSDGQCRIII